MMRSGQRFTEAAGLVAARARLGHLREQLADRAEHAAVRRRVRARRTSHRVLRDIDDVVEVPLNQRRLSLLTGSISADASRARDALSVSRMGAHSNQLFVFSSS